MVTLLFYSLHRSRLGRCDLEADAIEPGTELRLNLAQFSAEERAALEPEVQSNPDVGLTEWTGMGLLKALR